ncbi:MAG: hypothetical protein M3Q32_06055, partial [Pseudomonadota bacterium]|nr:hypothetical protein [Pseudomonadota bacterium]
MLSYALARAALVGSALCVLAAPLAVAASDSELAEIRNEINKVREAYQTRIEALEKRLNDAEAKAQSAQKTAAQAEAAAVGVQSRRSQNSGNPAISLILQGTYANFAEDPETRSIAGFVPGGGEFFPGSRGFSLAESELNIAASVDPYFRGLFTAALTPEDEIEIEEAWIQSLSLGAGFTAKAGRFFSGIG